MTDATPLSRFCERCRCHVPTRFWLRHRIRHLLRFRVVVAL